MQNALPISFAFLVGMGHAFEADHLMAVSTLVARHDSRLLAVKDGLYWGLGHTTTLVVFGGLLLGTRLTLQHSNYFEAAVGAMLLVMGLSRLTNRQYYRKGSPARYRRSAAYAVGLIHGLAGSGALVLLVMGSIPSIGLGMVYLLLFGLGSVMGMLGATSLMSVPFTQRMRFSHTLRVGMVVASALVSMGYGGWMLYSNLFRGENTELRTHSKSTSASVSLAHPSFLFFASKL